MASLRRRESKNRMPERRSITIRTTTTRALRRGDFSCAPIRMLAAELGRSRAADRRPRCSAKMRRGGLRPTWRSCRSFFNKQSDVSIRAKLFRLGYGRNRHANDNDTRLGGWLYCCNHSWCDRTRPRSVLLPAAPSGLRRIRGLRLSDIQWLPTRLHDSGWELRTLPRASRRRMANLQWLPAQLHDTGWRL